uniref:hypothetical protein n=1 Tax=Herbidospora sakaeratensis TaxID=564415 RepID=UPI0007C8741A|nr:hypothetical protein [Herbidospora sakaeratensis]
MEAAGPMTDEELAAIEELVEASTPGPWHVRLLHDDWAMSLVAVSTTPDTGRGERRPEFGHHEIVAATLIQQPRYADVADGRWDENARFIAEARQHVPQLIAEVRRLRRLLAESGNDHAKTEAAHGTAEPEAGRDHAEPEAGHGPAEPGAGHGPEGLAASPACGQTAG